MSDPNLLQHWDDQASSILASSTGFRFGIADSRIDILAMHRLRFNVVVEQGWAGEAKLSNGLEFDRYDERALQIGAWKNDLVVGTCRMVLPMRGAPLPTQEAFGLGGGSFDDAVDLGRLCVASSERFIMRDVWLGLLARSWLEARALGFSRVLGAITERIARAYVTLGLTVIRLGPSQQFWGERRFPILMDPSARFSQARYRRLALASADHPDSFG